VVSQELEAGRYRGFAAGGFKLLLATLSAAVLMSAVRMEFWVLTVHVAAAAKLAAELRISARMKRVGGAILKVGGATELRSNYV